MATRAHLLPYFLALPLAAVMIVVIWWPGGTGTAPTTHEIAIDAAEFAYTPGRIEVQQGDRVIITLTASDVVHGFALDGHDINVRVIPGISERIEFTAEQAGKFRFRCSVSCGSLHPFMIGELVVTPNAPFGKAAVLVIVALTGMLGHVWLSGREQAS
jgi:heme/copper-type cytochrome/quinol oxidase subunit 2